MTIGSTNQTQLSFIKEVTPGTTPNNPAMQILRMLSESLKYDNQTTTSEEITATRDVPDLIIVDQSNGGAIPIEFSALTYDEFLLAGLMSDADWTTDTTGGISTVSADATGFLDSANTLVSSGFEVGQFFEVEGFTGDPLNNGFYRALTVAAGEITTYPAPPSVEAAGDTVTLSGSTAKTGTTDYSYTIQKAFLDVGTPSYINFRGCRVSTIGLSLSVGAKVTGDIGIMGMSSEPTESQISGLTEVAKTTTEIMNAVSDASDLIAVNGSMTTAVKFTELSLAFDNKLRELKAIGTLGAIDVRAGTIDAKTTINPYFENIQMLQAFLANEAFLVSWQLTSGDGYTYIFSLPNVKFIAQDLDAGSRDGDLIIDSQVQGLLDTGSSCTMRIDKFAP